jgi:hypothetical protein
MTALLAACGNGNDGQLAGVDLDAATDEAGATDTTATDEAGRAEDTDADDADDAAGDGTADTGGDADATGDAATGQVVDLTTAVPGSWPVGDAGIVTFSLDGDRLVLDDVTTADGWTSRVEEEDADAIEFELQQGDREFDVEVELDDGRVEVEIDYMVTGPVTR